VFVGSLTVRDASTARFRIEQVRAGSLEGFAVDGLVDVRYGDEVDVLQVGERYVVGAGRDDTGVLVSTVRAPAPLFGGSDIAGIDDPDVPCPSVEDPVRTVHLDGSSVESGVLTPLRDAKRELLLAVLRPLAVALAVLAGLAGMKLLVFGFVGTLRDLGGAPDRPRTSRLGRRAG